MISDMTTPTQQPEALRIAEQLRDISSRFKTPSHERGACNSAIEELRRQHAEIARLTAENEALKSHPVGKTLSTDYVELKARQAGIGDSHGHFIRHELPNLERFAELLTRSERADRIEAQQRLADLQEQVARSGVEHRKAVQRCVQDAVSEAVAAERERMCAAIKAADDKASDDDYMLDSDDCISVIRGTWNVVQP